MKKEQRWELRYVSKIDGTVKNCYPQSEEKKAEQLAICKEKGIKVIHCKKLYPFNTWNNQHNFALIRNIAQNELYEIYMNNKKVPDDEIARLESLKEKSERLFGLPLPVAWLPWEDWKDAHELSQMAILHRQEVCIASGKSDFVTYC